MRTPRIFLPRALHEGERLQLLDAAAHHVFRVLRLKAGAEVVVFNGDGREFLCSISSVGPSGVWLEIRRGSEPTKRYKLGLTLLQGISKSERMDLAFQKAVELGAERLIPIFSERTVVRLAGARLGRRMEHWRRIIVSACEQSGRTRIPELAPALSLAEVCDSPPPGLKLILHPAGTHTLNQLPPENRIVLLVGPEGGLSEGELTRAEAAGFIRVRLGPRILRTETAPLAAIAALQALWGDFRD